MCLRAKQRLGLREGIRIRFLDGRGSGNRLWLISSYIERVNLPNTARTDGAYLLGVGPA